jgi:hypothetical protein
MTFEGKFEMALICKQGVLRRFFMKKSVVKNPLSTSLYNNLSSVPR